MNRAELEDAQKCVDDEILAPAETKQHLVSKRNMLALINDKLSPELLAQFFFVMSSRLPVISSGNVAELFINASP